MYPKKGGMSGMSGNGTGLLLDFSNPVLDNEIKNLGDTRDVRTLGTPGTLGTPWNVRNTKLDNELKFMTDKSNVRTLGTSQSPRTPWVAKNAPLDKELKSMTDGNQNIQNSMQGNILMTRMPSMTPMQGNIPTIDTTNTTSSINNISSDLPEFLQSDFGKLPYKNVYRQMQNLIDREKQARQQSEYTENRINKVVQSKEKEIDPTEKESIDFVLKDYNLSLKDLIKANVTKHVDGDLLNKLRESNIGLNNNMELDYNYSPSDDLDLEEQLRNAGFSVKNNNEKIFWENVNKSKSQSKKYQSDVQKYSSFIDYQINEYLNNKTEKELENIKNASEQFEIPMYDMVKSLATKKIDKDFVSKLGSLTLGVDNNTGLFTKENTLKYEDVINSLRNKGYDVEENKIGFALDRAFNRELIKQGIKTGEAMKNMLGDWEKNESDSLAEKITDKISNAINAIGGLTSEAVVIPFIEGTHKIVEPLVSLVRENENNKKKASEKILDFLDGLVTVVPFFIPGVNIGYTASRMTLTGMQKIPIVNSVYNNVIGTSVDFLGDLASKIPGLSQWYEDLSDPYKERFKSFFGGAIVGTLLGTKGKRELLKNPNLKNTMQFLEKNLNPKALISNFTENTLGVPLRITKAGIKAFKKGGIVEQGEQFLDEKIIEPITRKIIDASPEEKLLKSARPELNLLSKKKDVKKILENHDIANNLLIEYGYMPKNTSERVKAYNDVMKQMWNEYMKQVENKKDYKIDFSDTIDELKKYMEKHKYVATSMSDLKILEKQLEILKKNKNTITVPEAEAMKQEINGEIKRGDRKVSQVLSNGLMVVTEGIGKELDKIISKLPGDVSDFKKKFGALKATYEDIIKADIKNKKRSGKSFSESYSRIEGLSELIGSIPKMFTRGSEAVGEAIGGMAKVLGGKVYGKMVDPDFLVEEGFKELKAKKDKGLGKTYRTFFKDDLEGTNNVLPKNIESTKQKDIIDDSIPSKKKFEKKT